MTARMSAPRWRRGHRWKMRNSAGVTTASATKPKRSTLIEKAPKMTRSGKRDRRKVAKPSDRIVAVTSDGGMVARIAWSITALCARLYATATAACQFLSS